VDDLLTQMKTPETAAVFVKIDIEGHEPNAFAGMEKLLHHRGNFAVLFEFHVGLLQDRAYQFADTLLTLPNATLYWIDVHEQKLQILNSSFMNELIEKARKAPHPFNLFNLLLTSTQIAKQIKET
jgi:hypothetical protein